MAYSEKIIQKLNTQEFQILCKCEFYTAAIAIQNEPEATANHANRISLANKILRNQFSPEIMAFAVMTNTTLQGKIEADDLSYYNDMEFIIGSVYDSIANSQAVL